MVKDAAKRPGPMILHRTEFEREVERLGLTREDYTHSAELRQWCERNRERVFIPEWLLDKWGMTVEQTFSGVA